MEDNKTLWGILIGIGLVALFIYFRNKAQSELGTLPTPPPSNPPTHNGDPCVTNFNQNGTWQNGVCVQNIVVNPIIITNPPVNPAIPSASSGQITLKKVTPLYYQFLPSQAGYPRTYSNNPVSGISFPQGKIVTIIQKWQSQSGQGIFYETTEPIKNYVPNWVDSQHPDVNTHLFIKQTDL